MTAVATAPPRALVKPRALRDYQVDAVAGVDAEWEKGNTRTVGVAATGLGKTDIIAYVATRAARAGKRVLILAHRSELLDQISARCLMHAPDVGVGRVQAARNSARLPITVAMQPTLARAKRRARMARPDVVIVDEGHHAASDGYLSILRWAGCFDEPTDTSAPTPLMGVTATLTRGDKRELGSVYQSIAFERGTVWAIQHGPCDDDPSRTAPVGEGASRGWLVRPRGKVVVGEHLDLSAAKTSRGDWQADDLGEMVAQDVEHIVEAWRDEAGDRVTAAFVPNVASAQALAQAFRAAGVPTGEVYGNTSHGERAKVYDALAAGTLRVMVNVMVATEGWDCPPVSCVLNARPTKLAGLYTQMIGRGLRHLDPAVYPGHPPKDDCLVLDVVGASRSTKIVGLATLLPGAVIDDTEIEVQPCARCEGYTSRRPKVVALAVSRGMAPCSCHCEDCGQLVAECICGQGSRDPDGGRRRLAGRARYAEVDILGLSDAPGADDLNWLATPGGSVFLSAGKRIAVLRPGEGGAWSAVHVAAYGPADEQVIIEGKSLPSTRVMVEKWAREQPGGVHPRSASWRNARKSPTDSQLRTAHGMGIADPESYTSGALADLIDIERAARRLDVAPAELPSWAVAAQRQAVGFTRAPAAPAELPSWAVQAQQRTRRTVPAPAPVELPADDPRAEALARARAWGSS